MKYTGNYNLKKPDGTDVVNIEDFNENTDIIDAELKRLSDVPAPSKEAVGLGNVDNVKQASKVEHDQLASDFSAHQAEKATLETLGHVKAETDGDGKLVLDIPKSNYNATVLPTVNDDETEGYSQGSMWFVDYEGRKIGWICISATENDAVWQLLGSQSEIMLYSAGNEYEDVTGGWVEGYHQGNARVEKRDDHIHLVAASTNVEATIVTDYPINLVGVDYIYIYWENTTGASTTSLGSLVVSPNKEGSMDDKVASVVRTDLGYSVSRLDVRGLSGSYYLRVHVRRGSTSVFPTLSVYSIFIGNNEEV